jgi:hypothetical protein
VCPLPFLRPRYRIRQGQVCKVVEHILLSFRFPFLFQKYTVYLVQVQTVAEYKLHSFIFVTYKTYSTLGFHFLDAELIRDMSQRSESIIRGITSLCTLPHSPGYRTCPGLVNIMELLFTQYSHMSFTCLFQDSEFIRDISHRLLFINFLRYFHSSPLPRFRIY